MKKVFAFSIILLIGLAGLASCSSSEGGAQSASNEVPASPAIQEPTEPEATSTPEATATPEPIHSVLFFEEDFSQNTLDWEAREGVTDISLDGMQLEMPKNEAMGPYQGLLAYPWETLQVNGDCTFEFTMSGGYSFSGPMFNPDENYYSFILNPASVGLLRPSLGDKAWDALGEYKKQASSSDNNVTIKLIFVGEEVQVYVNDQLIASRTDEIFGLPKTFGGFYVVNGDKFAVSEIKVWGNSLDDLKIDSKFVNK